MDSNFEEFMQILRENIKPVNIERQVKILFNEFKKVKKLTTEQSNELEEQVRTLLKFWIKYRHRFKNLAKEIIREIYVDLYNITNKRHSDYMKDNLYSNDYYSKKHKINSRCLIN